MASVSWQDLVRAHQPSSMFDLAKLDVSAPFEADVASLNRLARAPMAHIGLGALDVYFEQWDGQTKTHGMPGADNSRPATQPSLWFDSLFDGLCVFGVEEAALQSVEDALEALSFPLVHAFCAHHVLTRDRWPHAHADSVAAVQALGLATLWRPSS